MKPAQAGSLGAGLAVTLLGAVLLLFEEGSLGFSGGWLASTVTALAGIALIASGIGAREP